jgi:penicillin-binding protein 1A
MTPGSTYQQLVKKWLYLFLGVLSVCAILLTLGIGLLLGYIKELPPIEQLENYSPPQVTTIYDRTGTIEIGRFYRQKRIIARLKSDIPQNLVNAFIAIEDKRFYKHFGIDFVRTFKAVLVDIKRMRPAQGASTITQQLPRNLLPEVSRRKILGRKIKETLLAFQIEKHYSKEQILEFYLNQIYLGNGAYGVQAAARTFFDKDVKDLTLAECATIAGITQLPERYSPLNNLNLATRRRNTTLRMMYEQGYITKEQYENAVAHPIVLHPPAPARNRAPYFVEYVRQELVKDPEFSNEDLYKKGYMIYTTLDAELQTIAEEELKQGLREIERQWQSKKYERFLEEEDRYASAVPAPGQVRLAKIDEVHPDRMVVNLDNYVGTISLPETLPYFEPDNVIKPGKYVDIEIKGVDHNTNTFIGTLYDKKHIQGAMVVLDAHTGQILAMVGGEDFYDMENDGQWNRAVQAKRQPGSAFKPFFYACAFEMGFTPATVFMDEPLVFPDGYAPKNYENEFFGPTTLQEALEHSRNVVTIMLYQALGEKRALSFVNRFDAADTQPEWQYPDQMGVSVCLGTLSMPLLSLAAAYIPFVNKGIAIQPLGVRKITDAADKVIKQFKPYERVVISPQTAYLVTSVLEGVIKRGTAYYPIGEYFEDRRIPEIAGKTGTTNDCTDAWFIGYTPDLVVGVFVGFDRLRTLGPKMTGSVVAGPIWQRTLERALKTRENWNVQFDVPEDIVFEDICSKSGLIATESCRNAPDAFVFRKMAFKKGTQPTITCTLHKAKTAQGYPSERLSSPTHIANHATP